MPLPILKIEPSSDNIYCTIPSLTHTGITFNETMSRYVYCDYNMRTIGFSTFIRGTSSGTTGTFTSINVGYIDMVSIDITSDGNTGVVSERVGSCYYFRWNGTTYDNFTQISNPIPNATQYPSITPFLI